MSNSVASIPGKRERTRIALIEAAIDVLAEKGLEGSSIDDLVRVAGLARGTFYNYFQTREDVICAVSAYIQEKFHEAVVSRVPADYSNEAIVACITYGFIKYGLDNPKIGWALVRIGGGKHWVSGSKFECADQALQQVIGEDMLLEAGLTYLEGVALMILRRLLEGRISKPEVMQILTLLFRGLGVHGARVKSLMNTAQKFVQSLREEGGQ